MMNSIFGEMQHVLSSTLVRLLVAAVLGGLIGLERQLRHKPAGLRTNMFICFGAAMFTILSKQLAGTEADSARIAAQIIPGIGFIGAGSILHARGSVTGLTTAATLFVVASVGMAVGGGLYVTAIFAALLILLALALLGKLEARYEIKPVLTTYEAIGASAELMLREANLIVDEQKLTMERVHLASANGQMRLTFVVESRRDEQTALAIRLHESDVFGTVTTVGCTERE